tara:strand:- start:4484 stop:4834 length:351 start_codon:yes stop_codon:yes gene_type:complete
MAKYEGIPGVDASIKADRESRKRYTEREAASRKEDRESDYEALRVKYGNRSIFKLPFHVLKQIERARRTNGNAGSQKKGSTGSSKPVKKMNRGGVVRRSKPRGVGAAKRGYGRAMR